VPLGGRGVSKHSSCSGLSGAMLSPRGMGSRGSSAMHSLRGRGRGAPSIRSKRGGCGVLVTGVSKGREKVEMKGEEMVEGGVDIWMCLMVMEWGEMGGFL
jgi:hypothetical protein